MPDMNKQNLLFFESSSMRGLYECMDKWQRDNNRRLLSTSIQQDKGTYCCIALTNPTAVVITSEDGRMHVSVGAMTRKTHTSGPAGEFSSTNTVGFLRVRDTLT